MSAETYQDAIDAIEQLAASMSTTTPAERAAQSSFAACASFLREQADR